MFHASRIRLLWPDYMATLTNRSESLQAQLRKCGGKFPTCRAKKQIATRNTKRHKERRRIRPFFWCFFVFVAGYLLGRRLLNPAANAAGSPAFRRLKPAATW